MHEWRKNRGTSGEINTDLGFNFILKCLIRASARLQGNIKEKRTGNIKAWTTGGYEAHVLT